MEQYMTFLTLFVLHISIHHPFCFNLNKIHKNTDIQANTGTYKKKKHQDHHGQDVESLIKIIDWPFLLRLTWSMNTPTVFVAHVKVANFQISDTVFSVFNIQHGANVCDNKVTVTDDCTVTGNHWRILSFDIKFQITNHISGLTSIFSPLVANEEGESSNRPQASFARKCPLC